MADVERERVTALWREAAAAVEEIEFGAGRGSDTKGAGSPDIPRPTPCAECGRLREQLAATRATLAEELEQKAEAVIRASALREQLDQAERMGNEWGEEAGFYLERAQAAEAEVARLREQLDAARQALEEIAAANPHKFQARIIARVALGVEGRDE